MEKLLKGLIKFREHDFEIHKELFRQLSKSQNPHTLFIGCSDSRLVPNLITQTLPGELFMVRNIANIVPPYRESQEYLATTSAIEYAVNVLEVQNIIVCGHSNCGGCKALYASGEALSAIPHTRKWLELAGRVKETVLSQVTAEDAAKREWMTEQANVVEQLKHLLTYSFIREKYAQRRLAINGWYYMIETGEVYIYNKESQEFELAN
ncbi:carbonic anhydrase [Hydrogenispora ethanolica]|uniref:Carbonic anhydrase n=1 Tax=Hydrogenispora ethanolica TaxID=1082276 RepID=A0A4R1RW25_HYDET|nr:carbonic anhydrase [Hydrogenispora ethanolica]TCL70875.1 carbonic anhydrase [Hydrogenispora ethanolica]